MDAVTEAEQDRDDSDRPEHPYGLFTTRMFGLLDTMRRSGTLAYRRGFGLSMVEWRIVTQLGVRSPLSLNDLAERIILDRGQLSRTVKQMVERGLLVSRRRPGGPAIMITLSGEGEILYRRLVALAAERNAFLVAGISEADLACASAVIEAVKKKAQLLLEREQAISATDSSEEP